MDESSTTSETTRTKKKHDKTPSISRELAFLLSSNTLNFGVSMYDRVKARPRGDLADENDKKSKKKKLKIVIMIYRTLNFYDVKLNFLIYTHVIIELCILH